MTSGQNTLFPAAVATVFDSWTVLQVTEQVIVGDVSLFGYYSVTILSSYGLYFLLLLLTEFSSSPLLKVLVGLRVEKRQNG